VTDRAKPRMEDYEMIYDNGVAQYLKCNHCGERVERGIVTVSGHWVNCQKRIENDKHPSEITVISSGHKTTIPNKINMSELTQIKPITANEAELKQLAEDYGNLVVTTDNLDAADKARLRLKNERITIQRQEKANNDVLKQIKKDNEGRAEMLIGIIKPVEDKLDTAITAIKEADAKKKEQEKLKEQNRVQAHRNKITVIAQSTARLALATNVEDIKVKIAETNALKGGFEEFEQEAGEAIELFRLSADNRVEQLQRIEADKKAAEEKKEEVKTAQVNLEWEGEKVVAKESPDGKFKVAVLGESQVEVTRPNGNHNVNDGISNVDTALPNSTQLVLVPDGTTPEELIKLYRQTGHLMIDSTQVPINYSTMGYDFHIPVTIPQQYQDKIKSAIESVLGEMPLL